MKLTCKGSLKRDLFFVVTICVIIVFNFASIYNQHTEFFTKSSSMQLRLKHSTMPSMESLINKVRTRALGLLDFDFIRTNILIEAPWAESHGADHHLYLGAGLLYYSFAYAFQCHTIVVLGSGGGFVPRLLRQAQRDLERSRLHGQHADEVKFQLILIDAHLPSAGWGGTFYAENHETVMRREFSDIRFIFKTTDEAFEILQSENIQIAYLHVDADHSFTQSYKDFTNYVSLLSPRGIVSFHDTCRNETRSCSTGVPETLQEIQKHPEVYDLQFLDAHYLYRGIAFAIRKDAPALEVSKTDRWNFCRNNAESLLKSSDGFNNKGHLSSLGAFYDCESKFNITRLGQPCPKGFRRSLRVKDSCLKCIPGLNGDDCSGFRYAERREMDLPFENDVDIAQRQRLIAAWLAEHNTQNIFEINSVPVSKRLYHPFQSAVAADPRMQVPLWSDDGEVPILRWIPARYKDMLKDGDYAATVELEFTDAVVCVDCHRNLKEATELFSLLTEFPLLSVIILECHIGSKFLLEAKKLLQTTWHLEADIVIGSPRLEREHLGRTDVVRQMMLFTRKTLV